MPQQTLLNAAHRALNARMVDFGGWDMPVNYGSQIEEHHAVRNDCGMFDVSHMCPVDVAGPDARAFLSRLVANDVAKLMQPGKALYSAMLTEAGTVIDDLIIYYQNEQLFRIVVNAGTAVKDLAWMQTCAKDWGMHVTIAPLRDDLCASPNAALGMIAVQGPNARAKVWEVFPQLKAATEVLGPFFGCPVGNWFVGRTGYTGEDGFELYVAPEVAAALWQALVTAGEAHGLSYAGLAARDTLRLEAGMPLYGHELGLDIMPHQAQLERTVALAKPGDFVGRASIEHYDPAGRRVLVGLAAEGRRAARADYDLFASEDSDVVIGAITSGVLSPTLGHPIAMALVDPEYAEVGATLSADIRGKRLDYTVTKLPFYTRSTVRKK